MLHADQRPPLVLLHGALGAATQFADLTARLADRFRVVTLDFEGHGARPAGGAFGLARCADNVRAVVEDQQLGPARLFGYSMGGYAALLLARQRPELVHSVVTLGTKFFWDEPTAAREAARLDPAVIEARVPRFAAALAARHPALGWAEVVSRTADLLRDLGRTPLLTAEELAAVACPVRVVVGDRDETVTVEETAQAYRALPAGQLQVLPATPHPLERVSGAALTELLATFFAAAPA